MALKARDMRLKIRGALQGKPAADQIRIIGEYLADWPPNVRGEYVEMRKNLLTRLEKLELSQKVKGSGARRSDDPFDVAKSGHITVALLGLPNTGKSWLFQQLGGMGATVADYPFTTAAPVAHVISFDNLRIQLIDLPPIIEWTLDELAYGSRLVGLLRNADVLCVVLDLSADIELQELVTEEEIASFGPEVQSKPLLCVGTKAFAGADLAHRTEGQLSSNMLVLSPQDECRDALAQITRLCGYKALLAKPPGQTAEQADRYWVARDAAVNDVAAAIHRELAGRVEGARVWGGSVKQAGQTVSPDHLPQDEDVVELILR